jgi:hypothetical protein
MDRLDSEAAPAFARRLRCNVAELVDAFDQASPELSAYLDLDTGEVITVTSDIRYELEAIYEDLPKELTDEEHTVAFAAALAQRDLPDCMPELVTEADTVETGFGTRFLGLPEHDSREGYKDMSTSRATCPTSGTTRVAVPASRTPAPACLTCSAWSAG